MTNLLQENQALLKGFYAEFEKLLADPAYQVQDHGNAYARLLKQIGIQIATKNESMELFARTMLDKPTMTRTDLIAHVSRRLLNSFLRELIAREISLKELIESKAL
jgi:hypothetical protein